MKQKILFYSLPAVLGVLLALAALLVNPAILNAQGPVPIIQEFQAIPTHAAVNWEYFTIGSDSYLAVANTYNDSTWNIDSKIYRWNGTNFVEFQSIPTNAAKDLMYFAIGSDSYLAVANEYDGTSYIINSKIYRWNGTNFVEFQSIPTLGAWDWEHFTIGNDSFLAVANNHNGSTWNVDSKIYRWNGTNFVEFQSFATNGANDWEHFTIGSDTYLALANHLNDGNFNIDSKIYRWNGTNFVEFQSFATNSGGDWEYFTIGSDSYLAVANTYNNSTWNIDSKIYRWNGTSFVEFQSIPTVGAIDWEQFTFDGDTYLAVGNHYNGSSFIHDSKIYRWNGTNFVETHAIPTNGGYDWEAFTIGSDTYLAGAHYNNDSSYNLDSKLYKLVSPNQLPTVDAGGSYTGNEGTAIPLIGASTSDPDGDPLTFSWSVNSALCAFSDATILNPDLTCSDNGSYAVTLTVDDGVNDPVNSEATVTVDNVPPTPDAGPDQTVYRNDIVSVSGTWSDPAGSIDNPYSWAWDLDGDSIPDDSGSAAFGDTIIRTTSFALDGLYTLTFEVTDKDNGTDEDSVVVEVLNRSPDCSNSSPSVDTLWPPNHKFKAVGVLGVTDPEGDPVAVTVTSIFQDEAVDAPGSGNTSPDGQGVGTSTAEVRTERAGGGNGRVYHISFSADDGHGGTCSGTVLVGVPHNKKDTPVDDGPLFDSTQP